MNWMVFGWVTICLTGILLAVFHFLIRNHRTDEPRSNSFIRSFYTARAAALERGEQLGIVIGDRLLGSPYDGLGLHPLSVLPEFIDPETWVGHNQTVYSSEGTLLVFAHQIMTGQYHDGFSSTLPLVNQGVVMLPGPTPASFTAALLPGLAMVTHRSVFLAGNYGAESLLWAEAVRKNDAYVIAAAGTLTSQAVLFPTLTDVLMGEEIFLLPGVLSKSEHQQNSEKVHDLLIGLLVIGLILGAVLKMVGVM
jgi:hypothetical protein